MKGIPPGTRPTQTTAVTLPATTFTSRVKSSVRATSDHIVSRLQDTDFAVIDARTDEEFIGWQLYGEARGGHMSNAINIPYAWFFNSDKTSISYQDLKSMLESRGITADKEVTAYCTAGIRSGNTTATNNFELGKLEVTLGCKIGTSWGIEAGSTPEIYGQNTAAGATWTLAVTYETKQAGCFPRRPAIPDKNRPII